MAWSYYMIAGVSAVMTTYNQIQTIFTNKRKNIDNKNSREGREGRGSREGRERREGKVPPPTDD